MLNKITQYIKTEITPYITNINYWVILLIISGIISIVFGGISYFIITEIKDFALSMTENSAHGSDSSTTAAEEISFFFSKLEIMNY